MISYKPVAVPKAAFVFCRYTVTILIWWAFFARNPWILAAVAGVMALSAMLRVKRAPLIVFYGVTIDKIWKSRQEVLNESAMRFVHTFAAGFSLLCLLIILFIDARTGWFLTFCFAILKTISAMGFCPASKLYECAGHQNCCAFTRHIKKTC